MNQVLTLPMERFFTKAERGQTNPWRREHGLVGNKTDRNGDGREYKDRKILWRASSPSPGMTEVSSREGALCFARRLQEIGSGSK